MTEILLSIVVLLLLAVVGIQVALMFRKSTVDLAPLEKGLERTERTVREEIARNREEVSNAARQSREEMATAQKNVGDSIVKQLTSLSQTIDHKLGAMRETIEGRLGRIQDENSKKLEEMRQTVDEKLHGTLEKRLGESFKLVSERLEQVYKGLGEMQTLASGVGDLKRVLTNVKTRGTWGEVQTVSNPRNSLRKRCPDTPPGIPMVWVPQIHPRDRLPAGGVVLPRMTAESARFEQSGTFSETVRSVPNTRGVGLSRRSRPAWGQECVAKGTFFNTQSFARRSNETIDVGPPNDFNDVCMSEWHCQHASTIMAGR